MSLKEYLDVYKTNVNLPSNGQKVEIRPLTTNDVKKLLVYEGNTDPTVEEKVLDEILEVSTNCDPKKLYLQDRYFLFFELRKLTKGKKHNYQYTCSNCGNQSLQNIDLDQVNIKKLNHERDKEIKVLNDKVVLTIDHITREEQEEALQYVNLENENSHERELDMRINHLASCIKKIETPEGIEDIDIKGRMDFLSELPGNEYEKIKEWFENNEFGVDLTMKVKCPHCNKSNTKVLTLNNFFD